MYLPKATVSIKSIKYNHSLPLCWVVNIWNTLAYMWWKNACG